MASEFNLCHDVENFVYWNVNENSWMFVSSLENQFEIWKIWNQKEIILLIKNN